MHALCARTRFVRIMTYPTVTRMALAPLRTASNAGGEINSDVPSRVAHPLLAVWVFLVALDSIASARSFRNRTGKVAVLFRCRGRGGLSIILVLADPSLLLCLHQEKQAENQKHHQGDPQHQQTVNPAE